MTAIELPALREQQHVEFDARRPWPLGLPTKEQAIAAIISHGEVAAELEGSHLRVLTLFPEWVFDEARTALASAGTELAWASASAWRAVVAMERIEGAISIDAHGLKALTEEVAGARERIVGYSSFALDGGAGSAELISTLDECLARFMDLAVAHERKAEEKAAASASRVVASPSRVASSASRVASSPSRVIRRPPSHLAAPPPSLATRDSRRLFGVAAGLALVLGIMVAVTPRSSTVVTSHEEWVVKGSIDNGDARLVPETPQASEEALQFKLAALKKTGVEAKWVNGEWVLSRP